MPTGHRIFRGIGLLWAVIVAASAPAAAARWEPLPLWGGAVQLAAAPGNPSIVYAASPTAGFHRSIDGGATWQLVSRGPNRFSVQVLGVDPLDPRRVWGVALDPAGSFQGLFRSEDGGRHWQRSTVSARGTVFDVAFDPRIPGRIYAAATGGLFRSEDQGRSWERIAFQGALVARVAVAPGAPQIVLASVMDDHDGTTFRSTDGGATFSRTFDQAAQDYVFDSAHPGRLYAINVFAGLRRSEDLGATWTSLSPGADLVRSLAITPAGTLLAGAYQWGVGRSEDGGLTWRGGLGTSAIAPEDSIGSFVVRKDGAVLAGGTRGVWKSLADGRSWRASSTGILGQSIFTLEAGGGTEPTLWASTGSGVFTIRDTGGGVQAHLTGPRPAGILERLAIHPEQAQIAYAFGCCAGEVLSDGLIKTENGGRTWELLPYPGVLRDTKVIAVDPVDPDIVYAGGLFQPHNGLCTALRSTDGGATWSCMLPLATADFTDLVFDPRDSRILYGLFNGVLYRSSDRGQTWAKVSPKARAIDHLTLDPSRQDRFFALSRIGPGVLRSDNGGRSWISVAAGLPANGSVQDLLLDPSRPDRVWVAIAVFEPGQLQKSRARVFRSDDAGSHWTEMSAGLEPGTVVLHLAADPRAADVIYAGTAGTGLYRLVVEE